MPTTAEVMQELPQRFRPEMAGNLRTTIEFDLTGPDGGRWTLTIDRGACAVRPGPAEGPDAVVIMQAAEFVGIHTGEISAVATFWSGRIQVEGSLDALIALQPVMDWR